MEVYGTLIDYYNIFGKYFRPPIRGRHSKRKRQRKKSQDLFDRTPYGRLRKAMSEDLNKCLFAKHAPEPTWRNSVFINRDNIVCDSGSSSNEDVLLSENITT